MAKEPYLYHLVGWTEDGSRVNRRYRTERGFDRSESLRQRMSIQSVAFLRAIPMWALEEYLGRGEDAS